MKILMSAYACEPGKGSEPEVGWQWALHMARFHEITVLTRSNNRGAIEAGIAKLPAGHPVPEFVYHDLGPFWLWLKRRLGLVQVYYILWQRTARPLIGNLNRVKRFDLMHHVTFAGYRYITAIWGHGVPSIWGPIGGMESIPLFLLPLFHFPTLCHELIRNLNNLLMKLPFSVLPQRVSDSTLVITSTPETSGVLRELGFDPVQMPTIGIDAENVSNRVIAPREGRPMELLFVGNLIALKGVHLALLALKASGTQARLTMIGDGEMKEYLEKIIVKHGLQDRVCLLGRFSREKTLQAYRDYDAFIFPSLHDSGGFAAIEAMCNGLPVICLDCGGLALSVPNNGGIKVPVSRFGSLIRGLASAISTYDHDRHLLASHGEAARRSVAENYNWETKVGKMNDLYEKVALEKVTDTPMRRTYSSSRLSWLPRYGTVISLAVLGIMIAGIYLSTARMSKSAWNIAKDTLPGLSYGGKALSALSRAHSKLNQALAEPEQQDALKRLDESATFLRDFGAYLYRYGESAYTSDDIRNFEASRDAEREYIANRIEVVRLMESNNRQEAIRSSNEKLRPVYLNLLKKMDDMVNYNLEEGAKRGEDILRVSFLTRWILTIGAVLLFCIGFIAGYLK